VSAGRIVGLGALMITVTIGKQCSFASRMKHTEDRKLPAA